jgi:hypothetical protein
MSCHVMSCSGNHVLHALCRHESTKVRKRGNGQWAMCMQMAPGNAGPKPGGGLWGRTCVGEVLPVELTGGLPVKDRSLVSNGPEAS